MIKNDCGFELYFICSLNQHDYCKFFKNHANPINCKPKFELEKQSMELFNWKIGLLFDGIDHELPIKTHFLWNHRLGVACVRVRTLTRLHNTICPTYSRPYFSIFFSHLSNSKLCEIGNENQIKHAKFSQISSIRTSSRSTTTTTENKNRCKEKKKAKSHKIIGLL